MLLAALGATIIGFVLLIVALVTANLWLAIACVVVSVIGVGLLLADVLTYRRADRDTAASDGAQWRPGDRADDDVEADDEAERTRTEADDRAEGERAAAVGRAGAGVDDATREARTVGHEEFGRHDTDGGAVQAEQSGPAGWQHESAADTDDEATRGLFAPGTYDPDMTDQIPQIDVDRAWGSEWTPREDPDEK